MPPSIQERQVALLDEAKTAIRSTDDLDVDYDFVPNDDGSEIILRRTVWFKARRYKDRALLYQEDVAAFQRDEVPNAVRAIVWCVTV